MTDPTDREALRRRALEILAREREALASLERLVSREAFHRAVELLGSCRGRILVSGLGKSGIVAQRIAASLRSTGSPAFFIHPVEALHGDLGLVEPEDVALLLSKSGETEELLTLVPTLHRLGVPIIAAVARSDSSLAEQADVVLDMGPVRELPELGELPTVSTTLFQVLGDLLVVLVFLRRGLRVEDLRFLHPGGVLGRQATLRVRDVMHTGSAVPVVRPETSLRDALVEIMEKRLGMTCVLDAQGRLCGILTDGDMKRILHRHGEISHLRVADVMIRNPKTIGPDELLVTALARMESNPGGAITSLIVVDDGGRLLGVVHIHDILRSSGGSRRNDTN
jgi:arabinose-5-phosphate isomerase